MPRGVNSQGNPPMMGCCQTVELKKQIGVLSDFHQLLCNCHQPYQAIQPLTYPGHSYESHKCRVRYLTNLVKVKVKAKLAQLGYLYEPCAWLTVEGK